MDRQPEDDAALVRRARAGDLAAFEALTVRHERQVYALARRIVRHAQDAEDVTQQTFLSALEGLAGFRGEAAFGTWLMRMATYAALKVLRKRQRLPAVSLDASATDADYASLPHPDYIADWRQTPAEVLAQTETREQIEAALGNLDVNHRLVFLLRDVQGLSVRETAEALGLSEANVKVRLLRARLRLREALTRLLGDPATRRAPGHTHR